MNVELMQNLSQSASRLACRRPPALFYPDEGVGLRHGKAVSSRVPLEAVHANVTVVDTKHVEGVGLTAFTNRCRRAGFYDNRRAAGGPIPGGGVARVAQM